MPELPEVETTRRGIAPHVEHQKIKQLVIRDGRLRWPVPAVLPGLVKNKHIGEISRRGKYLLIPVLESKGKNQGELIGNMLVHLGMSGSMSLVGSQEKPKKHDHIDLVMANNKTLRLNDPRRFGAWLWTTEPYEEHELISHLGPEPLSDDFDGEYLWQKARKRKAPIKQFIMDSKIVVGVGNIYANESLFLSSIHPKLAAGKVSKARCEVLVQHIKTVLAKAIEAGGTTLKDFVGGDGKPGYFQQQLFVYGRGGEPCVTCDEFLKEIRLGQRTTVFCRQCQK